MKLPILVCECGHLESEHAPPVGSAGACRKCGALNCPDFEAVDVLDPEE